MIQNLFKERRDQMGKEIYSELIKDFIKMSEEDQTKAFSAIQKVLTSSKIVVYGAGAIGRTLKVALDAIGAQIEFFCDKKSSEIVNIDNVPVRPVEDLKKANVDDYIIIIAVYSGIIVKYSGEIKYLLETNCPQANVIADGRRLAYLLEIENCRNRLKFGEKFNLVDCINCGYEERGCQVFQKYLLDRAEIDFDTYQSRKFETFFGVILGNVCTLRCKYCNEMIPYYKEHNFNSFEQISRDVHKVIDSCTFMPWVEFVGGEPFLHPDIKLLINDILSIKKIGYLKIFTNGTVVPDDELCEQLKNERIIINFSDYNEAVGGKLLENINVTHKKLQSYGIKYVRSYARTWQTFNFEMNGKTVEQLEKSLKYCSCAQCQRLHNGVLYRCHHQYAGMNLGKIPENEDDIIKIHEYNDKTLRERCDYFENKTHILACKYCNWPFDAESVPAAQQAKLGDTI